MFLRRKLKNLLRIYHENIILYFNNFNFNRNVLMGTVKLGYMVVQMKYDLEENDWVWDKTVSIQNDHIKALDKLREFQDLNEAPHKYKYVIKVDA